MSREYAIESSKLPLSIRGTLSQPAVRGVYLEELPDRVSDTSEISSDRYSVIEDDLMNVEGISDTSCLRWMFFLRTRWKQWSVNHPWK